MLTFIFFALIAIVFTRLFIRAKGLMPIEKLICWLLSGIFIKLIFTLEVINLNLIALYSGWLNVINIHLSGFFAEAAIVSYIMTILWSDRTKWLTKLAVFIVGVFVLAAGNELYQIIGAIRFIHWNFWYSVLHFVIKIVMIYGLLALFRVMLKKEGART